jgi:ATP-dependent Clp protease ATP-binding subunit ClpC
MWQRFTERARRAILIAQEEAGLLQSKEVTTSHLLLALLSETDSPTGQFLMATGMRADGVRQALANPSPAAATSADLHLSEEMKNLLTDSAHIARQLGHHDIDSHHLLLSLLSNPESEAARLLQPPQPTQQELYAGLLKQLKK